MCQMNGYIYIYIDILHNTYLHFDLNNFNEESTIVVFKGQGTGFVSLKDDFNVGMWA